MAYKVRGTAAAESRRIRPRVSSKGPDLDREPC